MTNNSNKLTLLKINFIFAIVTWVAMLGYFFGIFLWAYVFDFVTLVYTGQKIFYASLCSFFMQACCLFLENANIKSALNLLGIHILIMGGFFYFWEMFSLSL